MSFVPAERSKSSVDSSMGSQLNPHGKVTRLPPVGAAMGGAGGLVEVVHELCRRDGNKNTYSSHSTLKTPIMCVPADR